MKNLKFKIKDTEYNVDILSTDLNQAKVSVNGEVYDVEMEAPIKATKTPTLVRTLAVPDTNTTPSTARTAKPSAPKGTGAMKSPLPGKILDIFVKIGDSVKVGQKVLCLEAMKMENNINSTRDGSVTAILVQKGDSVLEGDVLVEIN
ncbi:MAG TPA: acetyl-CoA carboxylase biotin carboxyl carrier protein subunit [Bacteroidales bacterium]|nr:acetyl-CoA carboxylase biotin carboxyl carrier protein subunit [Bacteroidales bacterium]HPT02051.1 acetyl-CoA carboxylase biotin carboxyl carrier protein subunit [Bacteroidales bacterium]